MKARNNKSQTHTYIRLDALSVMLDEELGSLVEKLETERQSASRTDARPIEEEIAYVRREQQIRSARRRAHAQYVNDLDHEIRAQEMRELSLPSFDDRCNREYVDAARWLH